MCEGNVLLRLVLLAETREGFRTHDLSLGVCGVPWTEENVVLRNVRSFELENDGERAHTSASGAQM